MSKRPRELDSVKKKAARARFRKLVRSVLFNRQWLTDTDEQHTVSLNAKRNVATLFRRKRKAGILTMAEKALLGTASYTRTVEERKKLVSIVAHLACFSKIPPKIRARMVPCLRFMACGAGRRLMKEGDRGITIYFIVTGEVEMTKKVFNAVTNAYEDKTEAIYGPGDCVGDVDMLEQQLRTHSFTSTSACELLLLNDRDFHEILGPYAVKIWREKKRALAGLEYFSFMSRNQIVEACKFGTIKQYHPLDTIYSENRGSVSYVYFILSGECVILQCLHMRVSKVNSTKQYELAGYRKRTSTYPMSAKQSSFNIKEVLESSTSEDAIPHPRRPRRSALGLEGIEQACGHNAPPIPDPVHMSHLDPYTEKESLEGEEQEVEEYDDLNGRNLSETTEHSQALDPSRSFIERSSHRLLLKESEVFTLSSLSSTILRSKGLARSQTELPDQFETHFIDVGSLTYGGIFGLGETFEHRVIMARTTVQCLVLPRFWLMESAQNPGNIWQRQRFYIDRCIPSRVALFEDFLTTRKWNSFCSDYIQSTLDKDSTSNSTKIENIPIFCRIMETSDDS